MAKRKQGLSGTMIKVAVLTAGIVLIMFIRMHVGDLVSFAEKILNGGGEAGSGFITADSYTEEQQESMKKKYAGFWMFEGDIENDIHYSDLIEIKDNGIVWQYETSMFSFPYGDTDTLVRVSNSYLLPYQAVDSSETNSECYSKIIRQNWVIDGTPCYGKSVNLIENMLTAKVERSDIIRMWQVNRTNDSTLVINGKAYKKYTGDIYKFFHDKSVEAINSVDDPAVQGCDGEDPHLTWVRSNIIESIKNQPLSPEVITIEQKLMLKNYYFPHCFRQLEINYGGRDGELIHFSLTISPDGMISEAKLKGSPVNSSPRIVEIIQKELSEWILTGSGKEETIEMSVKAKSFI